MLVQSIKLIILPSKTSRILSFKTIQPLPTNYPGNSYSQRSPPFFNTLPSIEDLFTSSILQ
ncbi:hypothetical protein I7I50_01608 [Histoplasma capsulatum G186AR]|uniref:Uncharacterized protein n=1 Tax=Ajellomyces capsulatus TaxID=5037 RepID=A0A8H8CSL8_AJECA|nr:hypothetical protein I7I52_11824 [Histoplasma capsulatum]QSS70941.1 hypothetical protein I7I50_01608 [Histoplasma capsulatum G186AR]